jgi:hypothetical protein
MQSYNIDFDNLQMEKGFDEHTSYSSSKLCNAMHAIELASRYGLRFGGLEFARYRAGEQVGFRVWDLGFGVRGLHAVELASR